MKRCTTSSMCARVSSPACEPGTWRALRSASGGGGCRSACMPYFDSSGTRFFRSRAPMPCEMNQRPSLVWLMRRRMVRRLRRVPVGHPPHRHAPHHPVHDVEFGVLRHRLVHRHRHVLPLPAAMAVDQRGDDAGGKLLAGDVIGVPDLRRDRRRVVFQVGIGIVAAVHHDPAEREMDQVGALEILPRPVVAERRHARRHQRRKARAQRGAIQPQRLVQRAAARIQQHVRAFQQTQHVLARQRLAQVEHHRLLVAVVVPEEQRALQPGLILQERTDASRRIAFRRLDLHHLGAEAGEQQAGVFGAFVGDLDHAQSGQHAGTGIAHHLAGAAAQLVTRMRSFRSLTSDPLHRKAGERWREGAGPRSPLPEISPALAVTGTVLTAACASASPAASH